MYEKPLNQKKQGPNNIAIDPQGASTDQHVAYAGRLLSFLATVPVGRCSACCAAFFCTAVSQALGAGAAALRAGLGGGTPGMWAYESWLSRRAVEDLRRARAQSDRAVGGADNYWAACAGRRPGSLCPSADGMSLLHTTAHLQPGSF